MSDSEGRRRAMSAEQRQRYNAYQRAYRARNRDKVQRWRQAYILRKAVQIVAENVRQTSETGGVG